MILVVIVVIVVLYFMGFNILELIKSIPGHLYDFFYYVKNRKWKEFRDFGLELYVGGFGKGKTLYAVNRIIRLKKRYPDVPLYSNIRLKGVNYIKLYNFEQIVNIKGKAIVFCDEMGAMFNCRSYGDFPMALLDNVLQCRHLGLLIVGTAQKYEDVDTIIRKNLTKLYEMSKLTSRLIGAAEYDGYSCWYSNIDYHNTRPLRRCVYRSVSNKMRSCYDTHEIATNITNVIDDTAYDKRHSHDNNALSRYKKRYNSSKYSV